MRISDWSSDVCSSDLNGALVGLVETVAEGDELLIVNVAVHPDRQGEGHGVRLLRHAEALARADKLKGTRLYTNRLMATNIALYERLGYVREKETESEPGMVAVHMVRSLARSEEHTSELPSL